MLVRLLYASRARQSIDPATLDAIFETAMEANPRHGITGVLCHGNGVFLQALEGERSAVSRLFLNIGRDSRHEDVTLLAFDEIVERDFSVWSMGRVNTARLNAATLLKYSAQGELDPYRTSAAVSLALLKELVAGASILAHGPERRHQG